MLYIIDILFAFCYEFRVMDEELINAENAITIN